MLSEEWSGKWGENGKTLEEKPGEPIFLWNLQPRGSTLITLVFSVRRETTRAPYFWSLTSRESLNVFWYFKVEETYQGRGGGILTKTLKLCIKLLPGNLPITYPWSITLYKKWFDKARSLVFFQPRGLSAELNLIGADKKKVQCNTEVNHSHISRCACHRRGDFKLRRAKESRQDGEKGSVSPSFPASNRWAHWGAWSRISKIALKEVAKIIFESFNAVSIGAIE